MTATLVVKGGKADRKQYSLETGRDYYLGRSRDAEVKVRDQQASRRHCKIRCESNGPWVVADQRSSNGTYVNDKRIMKHELRNGDVISIDHARFEFRVGSTAATDDLDDMVMPEALAPQPLNVADVVAEKAAESPQAEESGVVKDTELRELFDFLDQIEAGESQRQDDGGGGDGPPQEPLLSFSAGSAQPASADTEQPSDDGAPLFSIPDNADAQAPEPEVAPDDKDGLLDFLKKKSQQ